MARISTGARLCDLDARPIRKGNPQSLPIPATYWCPRQARLVVDNHRLERGNPPDAPQLVLAVARVAAITGRTPGPVAGDRFRDRWQRPCPAGVGGHADRLQRSGNPGTAQLAVERPGRFARCGADGLGPRRGSGTSSPALGLRLTRLSRTPGA